jgi:hypothetical protein
MGRHDSCTLHATRTELDVQVLQAEVALAAEPCGRGGGEDGAAAGAAPGQLVRRLLLYEVVALRGS